MRNLLTLPNVQRTRLGVEARGNSGNNAATYIRGGIGVPTFAIAGQQFQSFGIYVTNTGGTLQSFLVGDGIAGSIVGAYANRVLANDGILVNIPTVSSSVDFGRCPIGIVTGAIHTVVLNTEDQPPEKYFGGIVHVPRRTSGALLNVSQALNRRNVAGVHRWRPEFTLTNELTGAQVSFNTATIGNGTFIVLHFFGFLA